MKQRRQRWQEVWVGVPGEEGSEKEGREEEGREKDVIEKGSEK